MVPHEATGAGAVRWSKDAIRYGSRIWGNWDMQERSNGTIKQVALNWETPTALQTIADGTREDASIWERQVYG